MAGYKSHSLHFDSPRTAFARHRRPAVHFTFSITIRAGLLNFFRSCVQRAVWQHGAAADKLTATRGRWTVEDLAAKIGNAR